MGGIAGLPALSRSAWSRRYAIACALLLVMAAGLRFHDLAGSTLRYDEATLANFAVGTLPEALEAVQAYHSAPMGYPTILWALQKAKTSPLMVRIVPAGASVLAIAVLVLWLPALGVPRSVAFLAGLMATASVPLIEHAQDAREYGIDAFVAALTIAGVLAWAQRRQVGLLSVALAIAPLIQYGLVLFGIAALAAAALLAGRGLPRAGSGADRLRQWFESALDLWPAALAFAAACAYSYSLTVEIQISYADYSRSFGGYWPYDPDYQRLLDAVGFDLPLALEVVTGKAWRFLEWYFSPPIAVLGSVAFAAMLATAAGRRRMRAAGAVFVLAAFALAIAVVAAALNVWPLGAIRQSMWLAPVACLAIGQAIHAAAAALPPRAAATSLAIAGVAVAFAGAQDIAQRDPWRPNASENFDAIMATLDDRVADADVIFAHYSFGPQMRFYRRAGMHGYAFESDCESPHEAAPCLAAMAAFAAAGAERFWFIGFGKRQIADAMETLRRMGLLQTVAPNVDLAADAQAVADALQAGA